VGGGGVRGKGSGGVGGGGSGKTGHQDGSQREQRVHRGQGKHGKWGRVIIGEWGGSSNSRWNQYINWTLKAANKTVWKVGTVNLGSHGTARGKVKGGEF